MTLDEALAFHRLREEELAENKKRERAELMGAVVRLLGPERKTDANR